MDMFPARPDRICDFVSGVKPSARICSAASLFRRKDRRRVPCLHKTPAMSVHCPTSARGGLYRVLTDRVTPADTDAGADAKSTPAHQWATRFFNLLPGRFEDPINCQLVESTIGEMQSRYEALSYTWAVPSHASQLVEPRLVVQEYAVARRVVFICGFRELPNEDFGKALEVLVDYNKFNGSLRAEHHRLIRRIATASIHHLWSTRQTYQRSEPDIRPDVSAVIYQFRGQKA